MYLSKQDTIKPETFKCIKLSPNFASDSYSPKIHATKLLNHNWHHTQFGYFFLFHLFSCNFLQRKWLLLLFKLVKALCHESFWFHSRCFWFSTAMVRLHTSFRRVKSSRSPAVFGVVVYKHVIGHGQHMTINIWSCRYNHL